MLVLTFSHFLGGCGSRTGILANIDLRCLSQVKLLVGRLFHQVIKRVLEHILDHVDEVVLEEHALSEEFRLAALDLAEAGDRHQLLLEVSAVLVAEFHFGVLSRWQRPCKYVEVWWLLICNVSAHQAGRTLLALVQSLEEVLSLHNVVDGLKAEVLHESFRFSILQCQRCLGLD